MGNRGVTLMELLVVIVLIGVMAGLAMPRIGTAITEQNVRSARNAVVMMHAKARSTAIQRSRRTVLWFDGNKVIIRSQDPMTLDVDTVGVPDDLREKYGVTLLSSRDSLVFDPRGLGTETSNTMVTVRKSTFADSVIVTSIGRVLK